MIHGYGFVQIPTTLGTTYIEDMRGNFNYSLNLKHVEAQLCDHWVLLDNQSTVHIFFNVAMLVNVRKTFSKLALYTNAGHKIIDEVGEFPGVGTVWVNRDGIANILSFHMVQDTNKFEVDYTSRPNAKGIRDRSFHLETTTGIKRKFIPDGRGLYYLDCAKYYGPGKPNHVFGSKITITENCLKRQMAHNQQTSKKSIHTITGNRSDFTKRDNRKADMVRRFQLVSAHPSTKTLVVAANNRTIKNFPFVPRDINISDRILGPNVYGIKGKRTYRKKKTVEMPPPIELPKTIDEFYRDVTLGTDVMHVNQIPFLVSISRGLHYTTAHNLPDLKLRTLGIALNEIIRSYEVHGFTVKFVLVDLQFANVQKHLPKHVTVNVVSKGDHVPEIERLIRVIKERARAHYAMLPFEYVPKIMIVQLIYTVVFYLNVFPWPEGVSLTLCPTSIVEGWIPDYNLHFQVLFGEYAQTYEDTTNTMVERTVGSIALGPSRNLQGGVRFFSLATGKLLHRASNDYVLLPMPDDVIKRVNRMGRKNRKGITFGDRYNNDYHDDDDPDVLLPQNDNNNSEDDDEDYDPSTDIDVDVDPDDYDKFEDDLDDDTNETEPSNDAGPAGVNKQPSTQNATPINESDHDKDDKESHEESDDDSDMSASQDDPFPNSDNDIEITGVSDEVESTEEMNSTEAMQQQLDEHANTIPGLNDTHPTINFEDDDSHHDDMTMEHLPEPPTDPEKGDDDESETKRSRYGRAIKSTEDQDFVYNIVASDLDSDPTVATIRKIDTDSCNEKIRHIHNKHEYQNFVDSIKEIEESKEYSRFLQDYSLNQVSLNKGLKKYGDQAKESVMKELDNLCRHEAFAEIDYESLSATDKRNALPILMFMVLKRNGDLKSRGCADGRPQRLWTDKHAVSSPTPAIEALKYILAIIAVEGRDVASFDLPGQFLQTEMDETLYLKIGGALSLLLVEYDDKWGKHLRKENGRPVIYVRCKKAIYGTLNAAILAYRKLTKNLYDWGLRMNPYEPCVWNSIEDGNQLTVVFHVDDGLVSHSDPLVVTKFLKKLIKVYGDHKPLTIHRGKKHEYLGMTLDFKTKGKVMITMYDFLKKLFDKLPNDMIGFKRTAAPEYLFKTDDEHATKLKKNIAELFHTIVATVLYLSLRNRADIQLAVGFLCTRVKSPDEHDYKKLTHLMMYLQATAWMPLILSTDKNGSTIYFDGAHAVHPDMKGHGGLFVTEGLGAMYSQSTKLKLNTISSTETELVTVGEKLPKCIWFRLYRIAQGGYANEDILMQDNQSTILLENNGRFSVGKGSRHINIRYFFITDRIKNNDFKVVYCPTEEMIADYFSKPLQGALFHKFRDLIQGINPTDIDMYKKYYNDVLNKYNLLDDTTDKLQECVGRSIERTTDGRSYLNTTVARTGMPV